MTILYDYFRSSAAYRVRIALNLKGLDADKHPVDLRSGEQSAPDYVALNPQKLVPTMVDDGVVLTQSLAIIEYLDETHPAPPLLPPTPAGRAWVRAQALAVACDIHPINNLRVLNHLKDVFGLDEPTRLAWYRHWIAVGLTVLESSLAASPSPGRHCWGDAPTLADICLVPQIFNAERFDCPLDAYPTIRRIVAACRALPAFQAAAPTP